MIINNCIICNKEFSVKQHLKGNAKYCSRKCTGISQQNTKEHIWSLIDKKGPDECWPWLGWAYKNGYGGIRIQGKDYLPHRLAYELVNGIIPNGLLVRHTCDNPPCCNPSHLLIGTAQDNSMDMVDRNRQAKGERNGRAKLTEKKVKEIKKLYALGKCKQCAIARIYDVNQSTIFRIVNYRIWKNI